MSNDTPSTVAANTAAVFKDSKLKLFSSPFSAGDGAPSLALSFYRSNVGFAVYTNSERDPNPNKYINGSTSYVELLKVFEVLRAYADGNAEGWPCPLTIENKQPSEQGNQNSPLVIASYTTVGKNEDGTIFIRVEDADDSRPKITFEFGHAKWHTWVDPSNGNKLPPAKVSILAVRATLKAWESFLADAVSDTFAETAPAPGEKPAGGWKSGGGGGNWKGGGGGNWKGNNNGGGNWKGGGGGNWKGNSGGGGNRGGGGYGNGGGRSYGNQEGSD